MTAAFWRRVALLAAASVAISGGVCALLLLNLSDRLDVRSDVIGYPLLTGFDVERYFREFQVVAWVFPALSLVLFGLGWLWARRRFGAGQVPSPVAEVADGDAEVEAAHGRAAAMVGVAVRSALIGLPLGVAVVVTHLGTAHPLWIVAAAAVATVAAVQVLARAASLVWPHRPAHVSAAMVNAVAAPFTVAALAAVAGVTAVVTLDDRVSHPANWLPAWLAAVAILLLAGVTVVALLRAHDDAGRLRVERHTVLFVAVPVLVYLLLAHLPYAYDGPGNFLYEDGQPLAGARLMMNGFFPWRDLMIIHGVWTDGLLDIMGMHVFGFTRWGGITADTMIWEPLFFLSLYALAVYVDRARSTLFALAMAVILVAGSVTAQTRYILWPVTLVLLVASLRSPGLWRTALLALVVVVEAILVPEAGYAVGVVPLALLTYEFAHRRGAVSLPAAFRRTLVFCAVALLLGVIFVAVLASQHAVGSFLDVYRYFLPNHELAGGLPYHPWTPTAGVIVAAPVAGWLASVAYIAARLVRRAGLRPVDCALLAAALMTMLFYGKFVARADESHMVEVLAMTLPMFILLGWLSVRGVDGLVHRAMYAALRSGRRWPLAFSYASVIAILIATATAARPLTSLVKGAADRFQMTAGQEPSIAPAGFSTVPATTPTVIRDLRRLVDTYATPGHGVFDMSNEPELIHYLMALDPPNRFFHISMAMDEVAQRDLVAELTARPPALVVFNSDARFGLPAWDGISNQVRHHIVAAWILDHYTPLADVDGQLVMVGNDVSGASPQPADLYAQSGACDWGDIPTFLSTAPGGGEMAAATTAWTGPAHGTVQIELPAGHRWTDYRWIEVDAAQGFGNAAFTLSQGQSDDGHAIRFGTLQRSPAHYLVHVGACGQWHGFGSAPLVLTSNGTETLSAVRLLP
ncbi:MAG TPA: hypothetical protein VGQ42_01455 [Candidatus Dormibacteraeota bacterium]|nr:hypothetical protein [Candidatus Dormibacteraeota bacterium]